jgi:hypothetical protein
MAARSRDNLSRPILRLDFADFWPGFSKTDNYFYSLLDKHYNVVLTDRPDYLIYSRFGKTHRRYGCTKIFYTGENARPNLKECDYAFTFDYRDDPRHYRLPLYGLYHDPKCPDDPSHPQRLVEPKPPVDQILARKKKFCCVLISNESARERIDFIERLSKYKKVDSGGRALNNVGYIVPQTINGKNGKLEFIKDYKFVIAFENSSHPGYTTEKLFQPMLVNSIPVYWGNPIVGRDFNTRSFVNFHDYRNEGEVIARIVAIDRDDEQFRAVMEQPYFNGNTLNEFIREENVIRQFRYIFAARPERRLNRTLRATGWRTYYGLPLPIRVGAGALYRGLRKASST